jgi:hypothetical protein
MLKPSINLGWGIPPETVPRKGTTIIRVGRKK